MIIATAGHVDHGKTSLVGKLTGIQTDTLQEEIDRGLSINLGYAHIPRAGAAPLSFIDVPGHQRFVNTMIAGVAGVNMALLVVAADDGPMPQTLEHLDILETLGVQRLTVAISKVDRVSSARRDAVEYGLRTMLLDRPWPGVALFAVSSETGEGVDVLKQFLLEASAEKNSPAVDEGFRLSIDRHFLVKGQGLVVTGTASAGRVRVGDALRLLPRSIDVRVRGLQNHDRQVDCAHLGQRVALNVVGKIEAADIARGDWLVHPSVAEPSSRVDVNFKMTCSASFPLKHLAPIKLYLGAKRVAGRFAILSGPEKRLQPGEACMAQLILDQSVSAICGDRFLIRDHAETVLLGGGTVLDPQGAKSGKSRPGRLEWLVAMSNTRAERAVDDLLTAGHIIDWRRFWRMRNRVNHPELPPTAVTFRIKDRPWLVSQSRWDEVSVLVLENLADYHCTFPKESGISFSALQRRLGSNVDAELLRGVVNRFVDSGDLQRTSELLQTAEFAAREADRHLRVWAAIRSHLERCEQHIPPLREILEALGLSQSDFSQAIKEALQQSLLVRISPTRVALPAQVLWFAEHVRVASEAGEDLTVIGLKTRFGLGRRLTIEVLEYFDSARFTRRQGDARIIVNDGALGELCTV